MMLKWKDQDYSMDNYLIDNLLDRIKDGYMANGWDCVGYICGLEGVGKTTIAAQICCYLDPNFNLDNVVFNGKQFLKAVETAKRGTAILFDEAYDTFENKAAWKEESRIIKSTLTRIRVKGLYLIIISPIFFEMSTYLTLHRSLFMIHCDNHYWTRGLYRLFNREDKYKLYQIGYKWKDMKAVKPTFFGNFTKFFPLDQEAYDLKKDAALKELISEDSISDKNKKLYQLGYRTGIAEVIKKFNLNVLETAEKLGVTTKTIYNWINKTEDNDEKYIL